MAAAAVGLIIAAGGANAAPPSGNGKPAAPPAKATNLARLLEEISLAAPADRRGAADAFVSAALGAKMDAVIDAALPALDDYRDEQRYYALVGLGAAGLASMENGEKMLEIAFVLVAGLADREASVRAAAAATLALIQPAPPEWAVAALIELLGDPNPRVASAAMRALERMPANDAGFEAAYSAFDGDNSANRSRAARLLG
ncbi:MAG: HEAT repeat domain-containing protein, partial [Pseudomonadota bacterium]